MTEVAKITPASGVTEVAAIQEDDDVIIRRAGVTKAVPAIVFPGFVTPAQFGATNDGATDSGTELQAWIDYLEANPDRIGLLDGIYATATDLTIQKPLTILGVNMGSDTSSASQPEDPTSAIVALSGVTDLITVKSATANNIIWGLRFEHIYLKGANIAERLLVLASAYKGEINAAGERATVCGLDIDDSNGALTNGVSVPNWFYQQGSNSAARKSHGLRIQGTGGPTGTQTKLGHINCQQNFFRIDQVTDSGGNALFRTTETHNLQVGDPVLMYNFADESYNSAWKTVATAPSGTTFTVTGVAYSATSIGEVSASAGLYIDAVDSCITEHFQGTTLYLGADAAVDGDTSSRKNTFLHVAANVIADDGSINKIVMLNSEPSSVTCLGSASLRYEAVDRTSGKFYDTERYYMSGIHRLNPNDATLTGCSIAKIGGIGAPGINYDAAAAEQAIWSIIPPREWGDGTITAVRFFYSSSAGAGTYAYINIGIDTPAAGTGLGSFDTTSSGNLVEGVATNNIVGEATITLSAAFTEGDMIVFEIERDGTQGTDDLASGMTIFAVEIQFEGTGPDDSTDIYMVPSRSI